MSKGWKFWHWFKFLNGKAYTIYKSDEAKELYGKQLISLSEKVFLGILLPLMSYFFTPEKAELIVVIIAATSIFICGIYLRHKGLCIIDEINLKKSKRISSYQVHITGYM
ncbi:hypothetical protein AKN92_07385 [Thiopseudomonas alkaliphila]|nr:hypothetical protein AKN92_07385 [Thiopseudomonas alkaliphila]